MSQEDPLPEFLKDRIYEDTKKDSEAWLYIAPVIAIITLLIVIIKTYE